MATGGFKSNATTDFLEEWKAKREKMRAKMLGDIAAATGANSGRHAAPAAGTELTSSPERSTSTGNCHSVSRSSSGTALKRPEEEAHLPAHHPAASPGGTGPKKGPEKAQSPEPGAAAGNDSDKESPGKESPSPGKESPSPGKAKEKSSSGPSARKGKGQIEKRKLREKRRSTGVVSLPSNETRMNDPLSPAPSFHGAGFIFLMSA